MNQLARFPSWVVASLLALAVPVEGIFGSLTRSKGFEEPLPEYRLSLRYQQCIDDLKASDTNGDLKVSSDEYVGFISTRSEGAIDVGGYPDLPFSLISNYVYGACYCSVFTGESGCCVGANAGISLDIEQYQEIEVNLVTLCRNIDAAIGIGDAVLEALGWILTFIKHRFDGERRLLGGFVARDGCGHGEDEFLVCTVEGVLENPVEKKRKNFNDLRLNSV